MADEVKIIKNRFLFVFEPHEQFYYGGAIGVIAETFEEAVDLIISANSTGTLATKKRRYKAVTREQFFKSKNSIIGDIANKWVLTHTLKTIGTGPAMILFDNWNYKRPYCNTGGVAS